MYPQPRSRPWRSLALRSAAGLLCLLGSTLTLAQSADAPRVGRIAYVDMQRLLDNAPQTVQARERLTREFAARDEALKGQLARLQQMETRQREQASTLPADEASRLAQEVDALRRSVERSRSRMSDELSQRLREESDKAWPLINEAVARYAREHDIDLVVPSPVVYVSARIDITDRVLDDLRSAPEDTP